MTLQTVVQQRLRNQRIVQAGPASPEALIAWSGAVQAQEYAAAKWGVGLRMPAGAKDADVEEAFNAGRIVRTHVLRPTWHFVAATDAGWMLQLTAPRVHRALGYARRYYEIDNRMCVRAAQVFERALRDGRHLTRAALGTALARAGVTVTGLQLAFLTIYAELERVICSGALQGGKHTYALFAMRVPAPRRLAGDEALGELTTRYFRSHGPATIRDFSWWSGLTRADARRGLEIAGARSASIERHTYWSCTRSGTRPAARRVHLLPIYDEYLVAYRDHEAVRRPVTVRGRLPQAVIADGQVAATWRPVRAAEGVRLDVIAERRLTQDERRAIERAAQRYGAFVQKAVTATIAPRRP